MAVRAVREDWRLSVGEHVTLERDASVIEGGGGELDLRLADDQRRQQAHDIIAGLHAQHLPRAQGPQQLLVGQLAFQSEHQPLPAHLFDDLAMISNAHPGTRLVARLPAATFANAVND